MKVQKIKIEELKHDEKNARNHSEKNIEAISASLERFGQQKPVVIDKDNTIIAGNGTVESAKRLGWKTVSVVVTELKDVEKVAFSIADNRTSELAEWNLEQLGEHIESMQDVDGIIESIGFSDDELEKMFNTKPPEDFKEIDDDVELDSVCPKCGFEF